jgi:ribonuclease P protein component
VHAVNQDFGKPYRLCSKKEIEALYQKGNATKQFPFYLKWVSSDSQNTPFQIVIVVPKRKYRLATTRNKIRRYIREAIRLEKDTFETFLKEKDLSLALFLIYSGAAEMRIEKTRNDIRKLFTKLCTTISNENI